MNLKFLFRVVSEIMLIFTAVLTIPLIVCVIYGESIWPFLFSILITGAIFLPLFLLLRTDNRRMYAKEGFVAVSLVWIFMSFFGSLPFVFSGVLPNLADAFFEASSGLTTTGATVITNIEALPRGILFWRSFTHWIGGMGIIVFMLAILPTKDGGAIQLMRAEVPGPTKSKLVPKIKQTALILYGIYAAITIIEIIALKIAGLPLYDAMVNSFSTAGTGGFSVLNNSIAGYNNPAAEWIIAIFMFLCGVNFNIYFWVILRKFTDIFKNGELKLYIILAVLSTVFISINVWTAMADTFESVGDCIRMAFFHVSSIMSTTGFVAMDYNLWPEFSKGILLLLTLTGACAGSTAGGLKLSRIIIIFKMLKNSLSRKLNPNTVKPLRIDGEALNIETGRAAVEYFAMYTLIMAFVTSVISIDGMDLLTNFSATATCFNNVGPGFGNIVGPVGNFAAFSNLSTLVLSFTMLLGRLEIIPLLILFSPSTWKKA